MVINSIEFKMKYLRELLKFAAEIHSTGIANTRKCG